VEAFCRRIWGVTTVAELPSAADITQAITEVQQFQPDDNQAVTQVETELQGFLDIVEEENRQDKGAIMAALVSAEMDETNIQSKYV